MKLKLSLILVGLVASTVYAADTEQPDGIGLSDVRVVFEEDFSEMSDEARLELAIQKSMETAAAAEKFQKKQAEYGAATREPIGDVAFKVLMRDAGEVAKNSRNPVDVQSMIHRVQNVQRSVILRYYQAEQIEDILISLAIGMSTITNAQRLGV